MASNKKLTPPSLSDDLIFYEIFPRLPAMSIHRFRCVSTSFRRLPSDKQFLAAFRRLAHRRYLLSFSSQFRFRHSSTPFLFHTYPLRGPTVWAYCNRDNNNGYKCHVTYAQAINGFICQGFGDSLVIVSNHATRETFKLLKPPEPCGCARGFFYFCHDPETDRYKVLRTATTGYHVEEKNAGTIYSVFTLGDKTKDWRHFLQIPELYQLGESKSVCIDGILYLNKFCYITGRHEDVICAFSVKSESFYSMRYPEGLSGRSRYNDCHLVELKGALVIIEAEYLDTRSCDITLWIKGKGSGDDDESWTMRKIVFDVRCENLSLNFSFSTNGDGEILMGSTRLWPKNGCWVFVYNMESGKWRRVEILGIDKSLMGSHVRVEEYVESPQVLQTSDSACVINSHKSKSIRASLFRRRL